jgi:hypothetical protein
VSEVEPNDAGAAETAASRAVRLSSAQMARMIPLLDEALELDEAGRREWLGALNPEYQDIADEALSLGSAGTGEALSTLPKVGPMRTPVSILLLAA